MNEDHLNLEIRKYLKKVGITSQRELESHIKKSITEGSLKIGDSLDIEMKLVVNDINLQHIISDKLTIE
tara:strand:+ start:368 stop:574 length:207 start_codon:yes stop_codon:yes gene_type:complete